MTKQEQPLRFDISELLDEGTGTKISYSFEGPISFEEIPVKSKTKGKVEIMKLKDALNVEMKDFSLDVEFQCTKCLENFKRTVNVPSAERKFFFDMPETPEDPNDIFLVDQKRQKIDITEPLRQEIILHFPSIPVCYTGCKGMCPVCGGGRNKKECDCKVDETQENKPLSALKDLLKE